MTSSRNARRSRLTPRARPAPKASRPASTPPADRKRYERIAAYTVLGGLGAYGLYAFFSSVQDEQNEAQGRPAYWPLVVDAANAANVPPAILGGIVRAESSWSNAPNSRSAGCGVRCIASRVCAIGLAQVLPSTAADMGVTGDLCDPANNLLASARYLKRLYSKYGDWNTAARAYNAGPGNVDKWLRGDASPYSGTVAYADKVLRGAASYGFAGPALGAVSLFRVRRG